MPPKSHAKKRPYDADAGTVDSSFDFLALIPSPVTALPPQTSIPTTARAAAPTTVNLSDDDPYAFMSMIPSPAMLLPASQDQNHGTAAIPFYVLHEAKFQ